LKTDYSELLNRLCTVTIFSSVKKSPVLLTLSNLFKTVLRQCGDAEKLGAYADFVSTLYNEGGNLGDSIKNALFESDNIYIGLLAKKEPPPDFIKTCASAELVLFSELSSITSAGLKSALKASLKEPTDIFLPDFCSTPYDFCTIYTERAQKADRLGYGIFAKHGAFYFDGKNLVPYDYADGISLSDLFGYERQREQVIKNTAALTNGLPAGNLLLCGDAGTGKSSTVKAVANAFFGEGVRLVELKKHQLELLPKLMGLLSKNPLKFIIFIDDLSFNKNDDAFGALKAALEGSASARAENAVIYATSNRRHLIKESFSDRQGDDVHAADTAAELMSLSQRFSLSILFEKPSKPLYLDIVASVAQRQGVPVTNSLLAKAEQYALKKGGRSARAARQFVELVKTLGDDF